MLLGTLGAAALAAQKLPPVVQRTLQRFDLGAENLSIAIREVDSGEVVFSFQPDLALNPASTMKLLTTYAALSTLTPGHLWYTDVYALGEIDADGVLQGDLALRGGGDPYLVEETLLQLLTELRRRGIRRISGDIVLDNSLFDLPPEDPGAFDREPLRAYNVVPDALLVNFKVIRFWFEPDPARRAVRITTLPELPNLTIENKIELVKGRCRGYMRGIEMRAATNGDKVTFGGRFPDGCTRFSIGRSLLDHDSYTYGLIRQQWQMLGGELDGGFRRGVIDEALEPLMRWQSRPFSELIRLINKHSNNVMTRQLFLTLGVHYFGAPATVDKAQDAIRRWLDEQELGFESLVIENGSGLSRQSRVTASDLSRLLTHAWRSPFMPEFISSLSLVGTDGTFRRRHQRGVLAGRAHLKSGRLDDVTAMAGYLQAHDGSRYALAVIHNETGAHRGGGEAVQDSVLRWLYRYEPRRFAATAATAPSTVTEGQP